jgi:hypothetical protein
MTSIQKLGFARLLGGAGRAIGGAARGLAQPGAMRTTGTVAGAGLGAYGMYRGAQAMRGMKANPMAAPGPGVAGMMQQRNLDLEDAYNFANRKAVPKG